ncbi:MAG: glycoside hydrolase family 78 protein [Tepidisphaeraceae bacterium]
MRMVFAALALLSLGAAVLNADVTCGNLTCEYRVNPLGLDVAQPRLSWTISSDKRGEMQTAYEILIASSLENLNQFRGDVLESGRVASDESNLIEYGGPVLKSGQEYFWKVRVWDNHGEQSPWSEPAHWSMGLLQSQDWHGAKWIGLKEKPPTTEPIDRPLAARYLRKEFTVDQDVTRATAYVCGLGLFEFRLNGAKVGDHVLEPALTDYDKRCDYVTFDVTDQVKQGGNAIGVVLGNGRYWGMRTNKRVFGYPTLIFALHLEYGDGSTKDIVSDGSWRVTDSGPIRADNEYDGEIYDARMELSGWDSAGYRAKSWRGADVMAAPKGIFSAQDIEPIRVTQTMTPVAINNIAPGVFIYDMGQNMVGWCRLKVTGNAGTTVKLRFAETLQPDGNLYTANLRTAKAADIYTLKGGGEEIYEPRFTYHGFRYVEVTGYPGVPGLDAIEGKVVHDDLERSGDFASSNDLLNKIEHNIYWGLCGNYRSIVTDCPQRDERQGWLGDRAAEAAGETSLFNIAPLYSKWLIDVADSQKPNGSIPDVAPAYWSTYNDDVTWPSLEVIEPGMLYEQYGDRRVLENNYPVMARWMALMKSKVKDGIISSDKYGDWCPPPESQDLVHTKDPQRMTAGPLLASSYYYYDLRLMQKYSAILGKNDEAKAYGDEADVVKSAFNAKFYNPDTGVYDNASQTSFVLPLAFGLVPDGDRQKVFDGLVDKIVNRTHGHLGTGLVGGQWLMRTLTDNGRADLAYSIATQKDYPGWGYMVENGATTIWELWNGNTANPSMNSGNHIMLVGDLYIWMNQYLAGIRPDENQPGYRHIIIWPTPVGDLNQVKATRMTPYGQVVSEWQLSNRGFALSLTIPANTTATVHLPKGFGGNWLEGTMPIDQADGVRVMSREGDSLVCEIGSGSYRFLSAP